MDLSPESGGATDRRDRRPTRERRPHTLTYRQNYNNLARYDLSISDLSPSTGQSSRTSMPRNETSRTSGKRPMRALNPQEKIDAINRVHNGESKAAVARDIGVPESTLRGWCKAEDKIRTQLNNMRASGNYEHILTSSSSDNSDNSRPDSSSRSTPTAQNTMAISTSGTEKPGEEPEAGPAPKRSKFDNLTSAAGTVNFNNISTSTRVPDQNVLNTSYLYNILGNEAANSIALINTFLMNSGYSPNVYADNSSFNRNNGAMTLMNIMSSSTNNVPVNGNKRKYNATGLSSSTLDMTRLLSRRQHNQSPNTEKPSGSISQPVNSRISPMPSTSATNGDLVASTSTKSTKDCKKLNAIICQLQQQQGVVPSIRGFNADEEMLSNNAANNNNNNVDHVNNETRRRSPNSLPPGFSEVLSCCTKLLEWLEKYGSAVCTFQQVTQVRTILENLTNWANSKESEPKKKSNGTS